MPLSDEEMRLLEQMERALVEEDPKFASTLRGTRFAQATRVRIIAASVAFVVGMAVLLTGAVMGTGVGIGVGVVGFVLMLASATVGLSAWHGRQATSERAAPQAPMDDFDSTVSGLSLLQGGRRERKSKRAPKQARGQQSNGSFMQRMEQRWQRRRDQRNGGY